MRKRYRHPGPDLWQAAEARDRAGREHERDVRVRERERRPKAKFERPFDLNTRRLAEIVALIEHRHGGPADTDDADAYFRAALPHIIASVGGPGALVYRDQALEWWRTFVPRVEETEASELIIEAERTALERRRSFLRADALAKLLRLTNAERAAVGIFTIGAIDRTKRQRVEDRKAKSRERCRKWRDEKRIADGKRARGKTVAQEAKESGVCRSTIYRRRQNATLSNATSVSTHAPDATLSNTLDRRCPSEVGSVPRSGKRSSRHAAIQTGPNHSVSADGPTPGGITIHIEAGRLGEQFHSSKGEDDPLDLIGDLRPALAEIGVYARDGGIMPGSVIRATLEAKRLRIITQEEVARAIGISRPQLANALQQRFGLSSSAADRLRAWLGQ